MRTNDVMQFSMLLSADCTILLEGLEWYKGKGVD